jgi:hypothetical protein
VVSFWFTQFIVALFFLAEMSTLLARSKDVPETTAFSERRLPDGTKIQYRLSVIQQPQRARACGMGAKGTVPIA